MNLQMNERLKELRKKLNLNQTKFGEKVGTKQTTVAGWETGGRKPSELVLLSICREFNVNEDWLRDGKEPMFIEMNEEEEILALFKRIITKLDEHELKKVKEFLELFLKK